MDDKMFEQRLKQLKDSYERIPPVSSPQTIMENIQKHEKKKERKKWFHLPYVASFIGVLLLGAIFGMQFLQQLSLDGESNLSARSQQKNEEAKVKVDDGKTMNQLAESKVKEDPSYQLGDEKYNEAVLDLSMIYDQFAADLKSKLVTEEIDHYSFVQEAQEKLNGFKANAKKESKSEKQFLQLWDEHRTFIIQKMATPDIEYAELERDAKAEDGQIQGYIESRLQSLINKQNELLPAYQERWRNVQSEITSIDDMNAFLKQLNDVQSPSSKGIQEFKLFAVGSGYEFYDEGEGMVGLRIDFKGMQKTFNPYIGSAFQQRLEMLSEKKIAVDGTLNVTFEQLGDYIVELEKTILADPSSPGANMLYEQYKQALGYYLLGIDNRFTFDSSGTLKEDVKQNYQMFLKAHGDTKTYNAVQKHYEMLERFDFKNVDEVTKAKIDYPVLLTGDETANESAKIEEALYPLPEELQTIYEQYKKTKEDTLLENIGPYDVMRLYIQASLNGEYEMIYALYSQDDESLPSKEKVLSDLKGMGTMDYSYINSILKYSEERIKGKTAFVRLYTSENNFNPEFKLLKGKNGIWKVKWLPMQ